MISSLSHPNAMSHSLSLVSPLTEIEKTPQEGLKCKIIVKEKKKKKRRREDALTQTRAESCGRLIQ